MGANRLHLRVKPVVESKVRAGHPWVFAESITDQNRQAGEGETAIIFDKKNKFLALGMYDAESPIRVRILHAGKPVQVTAGWWKERLKAAVEKRSHLFGTETNGFRLVNGENDGWPALVLDRYARCLVLKLYSAWWLPMLPQLTGWIMEAVPEAEQLVLRLSRNVQAKAQKAFQLQDGNMLHGAKPPGPILFLENGNYFEADVLQGQKTGFFLDQRENRKEVGKLSGGRVVMNAFSFTGGFSVYAAKGGAKNVTDIDISKYALEGANRNFAHNQLRQENHQTIQANVFDWLEVQTKPICDLLVIDPPSLAKREHEKPGALNAYARLAGQGCRIVRNNGILVAASCSGHVTSDEFFGTVLQAVKGSKRGFAEMKRTEHAADHPATFPEAKYLKAIYLQLG